LSSLFFSERRQSVQTAAKGRGKQHASNSDTPAHESPQAKHRRPPAIRGESPEFDEEYTSHEQIHPTIEPTRSLVSFMDAVVKVFCTHTEPNFSLPWQRKRQMNSTSSGFAASFQGQRCLLTNAHSVDYHTQVKVKKRGDDRKFLAKVLSIGVDCDVALLDVADETFWEGMTPLELGPLPHLQDSVAVIGYPIGGDTISVTAGVVSRIEVTDYTHGSTDLLAIQIDAAINGGNSGGPVFNAAGECCGIAFQALVGDSVENVGYVIPTPVIQHFLVDYQRTGGFTGFPALGIRWQRLESDALKRAFGMTPEQKGVLVRSVNPTSHAASALRKDDVVMAFDDVAVASDGTVPFRTGERIAFSYLISTKYVGDVCKLKVLREGKELELETRLSKPHSLVPPHINNKDPGYFIVAGLVFTTVNEPYLLSEYGANYMTDAPVKLLERMFHGTPQFPDEEVVVLSQVLACDATLGYEDIYNVQVQRFNGTTVRNLKHLAELVTACSEKYMRFEMEYNELVVLETPEALAATPDVMESHSVPHLMSKDLRESGLVWPPKSSKSQKK